MIPSVTPKRAVKVILLTLSHLALLGVFGSIAVVMMVGLAVVSVVTLPVFGLGILVFAFLIFVMICLARFESARVQALYNLPRTRPHLESPAGKSGEKRLGKLLRQSVSPQLWRPLSSFLLGTVFGLAIIVILQLSIELFGYGTGVFGEQGLTRGTGVLVNIVGAAILFIIPLIAYVHMVIAVNLVGRPSRKELTVAAETSSQQRESAIRAASVERIRLERDLHDGIQPRLVSIGMALGLAQHKIDTDPKAARELIVEAHTSTKAAITELRQLVRGIHASVLTDRGLDAALSALAARSHIPVRLEVRLDDHARRNDSHYREMEAAVYFFIAEAITNAAKHSRASQCRVVVRLEDEIVDSATVMLQARVQDDGIGGAEIQPGGGLDGIAQRVHAIGGAIRIDSPSGGPTIVEVNIPCAS